MLTARQWTVTEEKIRTWISHYPCKLNCALYLRRFSRSPSMPCNCCRIRVVINLRTGMSRQSMSSAISTKLCPDDAGSIKTSFKSSRVKANELLGYWGMVRLCPLTWRFNCPPRTTCNLGVFSTACFTARHLVAFTIHCACINFVLSNPIAEGLPQAT